MNKFRHLLQLLLDTFDRLSPADKERYIERFSITIAVGVACVASSFFYWFLPPLVRVLVVPVFIGAAWWAGAKLVAPAVANRAFACPPRFPSLIKLAPFHIAILVSLGCASYGFFYWTFPSPERLLIPPLILSAVCAGWFLNRPR